MQSRTSPAGAGPTPAAGQRAAAIEVEGLVTGYAGEPALRDVSFSVPGGVTVGVVGPNGAGKSTLLRTLLGFLPAWEGAVAVDGAAPAAARERIGYMPQAEAVDWSFPISVRESVAIGLYRREFGWARARRIIAAPFTAPFTVSFRGADARIERALARVGLDGLSRQQVRELSAGQQRRALLARALVKDPPLLLLDEPLAGLDAAIEEDLLHLFRSLAAEGKTLIIATHDVPCVMRYYDLALCLNRRVIAFGPPRDVMSEDVLERTFGRHLVLLQVMGRAYAAEPHDAHRGAHE